MLVFLLAQATNNRLLYERYYARLFAVNVAVAGLLALVIVWGIYRLLARLRVDKGDELYALETPDGIRLTAFDPELAAQMEVAEQVMRKRRSLLNTLAQ